MNNIDTLYADIKKQIATLSSSSAVNFGSEAALSRFGRHLLFQLDEVDLVYESDGETLQTSGPDKIDNESIYKMRFYLFDKLYALYTNMISQHLVPSGFRGHLLCQQNELFKTSTNKLAILLEETLGSYVLETHSLHPRQLLYSAGGAYKLDDDHLDFVLKDYSEHPVYEVRAVCCSVTSAQRPFKKL